MHQCAQESTSYAPHPGHVAAQTDSFTGIQRPMEACAISYIGPLQLRNRSNGTVLPTITEQSSNLTLGTYNTLQGSGTLFPFNKTEGGSQRSASLQAIRIPDGPTSHVIPVTVTKELKQHATVSTHEKQAENHRVKASTHDSVGILNPISGRCSQFRSGSFGNTYLDIDSRSLRGVVRGVFQNVRAALRTKSRSSLSTELSLTEHREPWPPASQERSPSWENDRVNNDRLDILCRMRGSSFSVASSPRFERQSTNRNTSTADTEYSAHACLSTFDFPIPDLKPKTDSKSDTRWSPGRETPSRERPSSVHLVQLEPRDMVYKDNTAGSRVHSADMKDHDSARGTFYDTAVSYNNAHSPPDGDSGREASPNTSFCGTISTSYSGTVLGVDLDLHRTFGPSMCHSSSASPAATEWSELQVAELEHLVPVSEPQNAEQSSMGQPPFRTITSSALASLLPIATASGIVRPNYNTPKISFYSPSGNIIEPEDSIASDASESDLYSLRNALLLSSSDSISSTRSAVSATACLPPPRPLLAPMTTPPTSLTPLPAHLKYHHNYQKPEKSQISPSSTFVVPGSAVIGCGGMVRTKNSVLQNVLHSTTHWEKDSSPHRWTLRSTASKVRDVAGQALLHQTCVIAATSIPQVPSRMTNRSCDQQTPIEHASTRTITSRKSSPDITSTIKSQKLVRRKKATKDLQDTSFSSALPGHALRVCFCQPYDGAGQRTQSLAAEASCLNITSAATAQNGEAAPSCDDDNALVDSAEHLVARTVEHVKTARKKARSSMGSSNAGRKSRSRDGARVGQGRPRSTSAVPGTGGSRSVGLA